MQEDHKIDSASLAVTSEASTDAQGDDRVVHPSSRLWRPLEPTVVVAQIASVCGCIATIGLVAWGKAARPNDGKGVTDVFGGSCEQVNRLSTFAHLGLNVPAVIILASGSAALWRIAEKGLGAWRTPAWWLLFLALLFTPVLYVLGSRRSSEPALTAIAAGMPCSFRLRSIPMSWWPMWRPASWQARPIKMTRSS